MEVGEHSDLSELKQVRTEHGHDNTTTVVRISRAASVSVKDGGYRDKINPGMEEAERLKPSKGTQWVTNPTRKGWPPPEASFASSSEMAARSVNSECQSRGIELRNHLYRGGFPGYPRGEQHRGAGEWQGTEARPESKSRAKTHWGSLGTCENQRRPQDEHRRG